MRLTITDHACRRYLERIDPATDPEAAIRLAMRTAVRLDRPARDGCAFWRCARFVLVCLDVDGERVVCTVIGLDRIERVTRARTSTPTPVRKAPRPYRHPRR